MFKRFDDGSEEEEITIDPNDLGLLEHPETTAEALKLLRPLTRKSIKPTRLFQTEEQKRAREAEKAEEEVTDIEDHGIDVGEPTMPEAGMSASPRRSLRTAVTKSAHTPNGNSTLSKDDSGIKDVNGRDSPTTEKEKGKKTGKGSPFDSWKRTKPGNSTPGMSPNKGRKRTSSSMEEGEDSTMSKKLRNR